MQLCIWEKTELEGSIWMFIESKQYHLKLSFTLLEKIVIVHETDDKNPPQTNDNLEKLWRGSNKSCIKKTNTGKANDQEKS